MVTRVPVRPEMLSWALERSGPSRGRIADRFKRLGDWQAGRATPTMKQLETFAEATHTPVGFLFLAKPPADRLPIPDFRTFADDGVRRPSVDLLETIFACQQRQEWYRSYAEAAGDRPAPLVGLLQETADPTAAGIDLRHSLLFEVETRGPTWTAALDRLVERADSMGVLVMISGIVGSNTRRKLDPREFRGFALADPMAPIVFVNGADTKAAQLFTLAHELAHIAVNGSALSDARLDTRPRNAGERWCNEVAAEVLVPIASLREHYQRNHELVPQLDYLARIFKASTLVVLRRIYDAGYLEFASYLEAYHEELERVMSKIDARRSEGGSFYNTLPRRLSRRFTRAVVASALQGQTLYRDAFQLLGFQKQATFDRLANHLGVQ